MSGGVDTRVYSQVISGPDRAGEHLGELAIGTDTGPPCAWLKTRAQGWTQRLNPRYGSASVQFSVRNK